MNIRLRKTVKKALIKKKGTTAIKVEKAKKRCFDPASIGDQSFKAVYDKDISFVENLKAANLKELFEEKLPESIPRKAAWTMPKLSEEENAIVQRMVSAHGDNFKKMAFNRKLNIYQWTEEQVQRKVDLLNQGRVHVCDDGKCLCGYTPNSSYVPHGIARKRRHEL